ncbi:MAG TPA: hypothetical protein P5191_12965 [Ruminococcus sp.]|nr:hypothetical protein [Ruminococcus sp.]
MKNKITAFLTTGLMMTSAVALPPVEAVDRSVKDPVIGVLPDWVPQNFAEAMNFYNDHGKTYVADNVICLVRPVISDRVDNYSLSIGGSMHYVNTPASAQPKVYEIEIPEMPDPEDYSTVKAYEDYCDSLGLYSHDYEFFENYAQSTSKPAFKVELFRVLEGYDLTLSLLEKSGDSYVKTDELSFDNPDGTTVETDIYSWLPDCVIEFNSFLTEYGRASVHENNGQGYLVYMADVNGSTGASLKMEQSGEGKLEEFMESECARFDILPPVDGEISISAKVYKPVSDGDVDVKWTIGREWDPDEPPFNTKTGNYEIKENCSVIVDHSPLRRGSTVFTLIDKRSGSLIDIPEVNDNYWILKETIEEPYTSEIYELDSNPCIVDKINAYSNGYRYSVKIGSFAGEYTAPEFEVTGEDSYHVYVNCYLEWIPSGDANKDEEFNVADMVTLQKWLLSDPDAKIADWNAVDFCRDNRIDAFDLCMMKQVMLERNMSAYVEPDNTVTFGGYCTVKEDGLGLYTGPGEEYVRIAKLPEGTAIRELGYMTNNYLWMFIKYNGQYGWIKLKNEDDDDTVFFEAMADKPVIYLYPEEETDVHVELELTESDLATTYPKYNNGWDVTAYPDGVLLNKADGTHHRYLFWDSTNCRTRFDFSKGFCVAGSDTESFLKEKLTYMGLTENEMNEFIVYWLPRMEHNKYNLISFQDEAYTNSAKLDITPSPDSECRVFMAYVPLEDAVEVEPQQLETFERKGFAVVEWGGCEIKN